MAASRIYGLFAAAIFLAVLSLALFQSDVIRAATLLKPEGANSTVPISLPHTALSDAKSRSVIYTVSIDHKFYGSAKWNMIADDCIREISVNKHSIDLASTQGNLCDIHKGITVDLSPYLVKGVNSVAVKVEDIGAAYAFDMRPYWSYLLVFNGLVSVIFIVYFCYLLSRYKVGNVAIGLFILWAIVSLHYLHISNNDAYTNDVGGHIARAQFIAYHLLEPYGYNGWQEHHPPLYYYVAGLGIRFADALGTIPTKTVLRFISWLSYAVFSIYSLRALHSVRLPKFTYYMCAALLLLWPFGFHVATKISPEPLYYALYSIAFYHALMWYQQGKQTHLMKALIWAGVAFTVRTNAIIIFTIIGILLLVALYRRRIFLRDFMSKKWCGVLACLILCLFVSIGNVIFNNYTIGDHFGSFAFGATTFPLSHYLDIHYYYSIQHPFNDWSLNQSFWDYLIKTAIFGEYSDWSSPHVATALVFLLMALILYTFLPWLVAKRQNWRGMLPHLLTGIALIYLIGFTVKGGVWPFNDVRYIFPSLVCLTIFFGKSYEIYKERGALVLLVLGPLLVVCFTTLSIFFFWNNFR